MAVYPPAPSGIGATLRPRFNKKYVYLLSTVAALGGALFGFDLVIISGTVAYFTENFSLNEYEIGWAVGCINIGAAVGAVVSGRLSETVGRKRLLMFCAGVFAITGAGTGWATTFPFFIVCRILSGLAVGAAALVCPIYVAEISPAPMRGRMVSFYQLSIVVGILLAYGSNYLLLESGPNNWRWMFTSQSAPALFFLMGLFLVSESPRWLIANGREMEARITLERIGGLSHALSEEQHIASSFEKKVTMHMGELFHKDIRHVVIMGIIIAVFSQAVGQNSIFSYAPELFKQAGMGEQTAFLQSITIGLLNFAFTFVAITTIDRIGRKFLLKLGSFLLFADAMALSAAFQMHWSSSWILGLVLGFIAIYSATIGPVTWVILSEIFPNRIRGSAMAAATLALWVANFFTTSLFPVMNQHYGLGITFFIHAVICLAYFIFVTTNVPETKGKSLEEIEKVVTQT
ncbi:sugar porter family MFS transporter [Dyadobacter sp. MSC1_007]|jgi:SP family arabinose:H+ symporter-like MFS transporter|uniref:sugar porter family MFS transporter n=1 Tax=Dyadobacter sp. MSC1_007 TaxID=2909264 RepID=UPI00202E4B6C|nr:sugar porter family MFS transporter [Dyadobacter sp. MSC1_007]